MTLCWNICVHNICVTLYWVHSNFELLYFRLGLFTTLICSLLSSVFSNTNSKVQVAERALFFWNNAQIVSLISENRNVIFPIVFEALEKNIGGHWNKAIHGLSSNVQRMFIDMDNELFQDCQRQYLEKEAMVQELDKQRALMWRKLEAVATQATADDMVIVNWIIWQIERALMWRNLEAVGSQATADSVVVLNWIIWQKQCFCCNLCLEWVFFPFYFLFEILEIITRGWVELKDKREVPCDLFKCWWR